MPRPKKKLVKKNFNILQILTAIFIFVFALDVLHSTITNFKLANFSLPFIARATPTPDPQQIEKDAQKQVLPDKVNLGVSFKDNIIKLVDQGAIDKNKFLPIYENNPDLSSMTHQLLDAPSDTPIVMTQANAGLLLNLLWPLGLSNKTNVLSSGPMGQHYLNDVGNFASTGGWTLGKIGGGKLFNSLSIFPLTLDQEKEVSEIAQTIYRPCCGNSTYFPDCNHGAAMLGFIELAVTQGLSKEDIYKKALALNSYWFPQTYVELAIYFKQNKNITWDKVDPKEALNMNYSSAQGYAAVSKELQTEGLIPKVKGGSSC